MICSTDKAGIERAVAALRAGQIVAVPTDTVYGLVASFDSPAAIEEIFRVKGRSHDIALPVLCASAAEAHELGRINGQAARLADEHWPGALTLVVERRPGLTADLGGEPSSIGLRVPDHHALLAIAQQVGPLASSSANRHGEPPVTTSEEALGTFGDDVPLVLTPIQPELTEAGAPRQASTVLRADTEGNIVEVLRAGDIDAGHIQVKGR